MPVVEINYNSLKSGTTVVSPTRNLMIHGGFINVAVSPIKKESSQDNCCTIVGKALIDTGATLTCIDETICQELEIKPVWKSNVKHVDGLSVRTCYPVQISFPDIKIPPLRLIRATSVNLSGTNPPFIALIGRDLLSRFKLTYNGPRGRIEIAY